METAGAPVENQSAKQASAMGTLPEETAAIEWMNLLCLTEEDNKAYNTGPYTRWCATRDGNTQRLLVSWKSNGIVPFRYDHVSNFSYMNGRLRYYSHLRNDNLCITLVYRPTSGLFRYDNANCGRHEDLTPEETEMLMGKDVMQLEGVTLEDYPHGSLREADFSTVRSAFFALDLFAADFSACVWPTSRTTPDHWDCVGDDTYVKLVCKKKPSCKIRMIRCPRTMTIQIISLGYENTSIRVLLPLSIEISRHVPDNRAVFAVRLKTETDDVVRGCVIYPFPPPYTTSQNAIMRIENS